MLDNNRKPIVFNDVVVDIFGKPYTYFMTDNIEIMNSKLGELGCRPLQPWDFRYNPSLAKSVQNKMADLGVHYSLVLSNGSSVVNYYTPGYWPLIVYLQELLDPWRKASNDNKSISVMQQMQDMLSIETGTSVQKNWPPLMTAVLREDFDAIRFLIDAGVALDDRSTEGFTALMIAVVKNNKELVKLLIEKGAGINTMTNNGWTPYRMAICLYLADAKNRKEIAEILRKAGAKTDFKVLSGDAIKEKMTFHDKLNAYLHKATYYGCIKESIIYKRCGMDKRTFSKIKNTTRQNYQPRKNNVFLLIIGMELSLSEAEDLLASAGYFFNRKDEFEEIIRKYIKSQDYNIGKIERELFDKTSNTLCDYGK